MTRRRILILFATFCVVLSGAMYVVLHQTGAARSLVRSIIGETIRDELFKIDDAEIDLTAGTVTVRRFQLDHPNKRFQLDRPDLGHQSSPLLSVDKIEVEVETNPLGEVGAVRHVALEGLVMNLSLAEGEIPEISRILRVAGVPSGDAIALPSITATNSTVILSVARERPPITFTNLTLRVLPVRSNPDEVDLTGTMVSPLGHTIQIRGGGNAKDRNFRTLLIMQDIPIKPQQAAAYQNEAASFLDSAKVTGLVKEATLWIDLRDEIDEKTSRPVQRLKAGLNAEFENLSAAPEHFPYQINGASGRIHASLADDGAIKFRLENKAVDGNLTATGKITRCLSPESPLLEIQLDIEDLLVGPRLKRAFANSSIAEVSEYHSAFAPSAGRISAKVQVYNNERQKDLQVAADVTLAGVSAQFNGLKLASGQTIGFPYPIENVDGLVTIRSDRVTLENLTGQDKNGAKLKLNGQINIVGEEVRPNLDVHAQQVEFSKAVRDSLESLVAVGAEFYDMFSPKGECDIVVRLRDAGAGVKYDVELNPRSATATYVEFPYAVDALQGLVRIDNEWVRIDLRGERDGTPVGVDGRFYVGDDKTQGSRSELFVKATKLRLDGPLETAASSFSKAIGQIWTLASPTGRTNCEFAMWKEVTEEEFSYDVHLHILDGTAVMRDFPLPITGLRGDLFLNGTGERCRCDISPLHGEIENVGKDEPARILVQGTILHGPEGQDVNVTTIARKLRLSDRLGEALDKSGMAPKSTWDALELDGLVDVIAHKTKSPADPDLNRRFVVRLRDVESRASFLPGFANQLHGEVVIGNSSEAVRRAQGGTEDLTPGAIFDRLEGKLDDTAITLRVGTIKWLDKSTKIRFTMDSDGLPVNEKLGRLMSGPTRKAFLESRIRGQAKLSDFTVQLIVPDGIGADPSLEIETTLGGEIHARDLFMAAGLPHGTTVDHLTGTARIDATINARGGRLTGDFKNIGFDILNQRVSGIEARFEINPEKLTLHNLSAEIAGGRLYSNGKDQLALSYTFAGKGTLEASVRYSDVSLNDLLKNRSLSHTSVRGLVNGAILIERLDGSNFIDMVGEGYIKVRNGRLGRVPIFSALYSHIAEDKRPQFSRGQIEFVVKEQKIKFTKIFAASEEIKIEGDGSLDMDGYMDVRMRLPGIFGRVADLLILPPLIDWTVGKVVSFQLYGYIRDPKLSWAFPNFEGRTSLGPIGPAMTPRSDTRSRPDPRARPRPKD